MHRKFQQMNNRELLELLQRGGALVDIRREEEWQLTGVVEGSQLLTFFAKDGSSEPLAWLEALTQMVPQEQPLALICRSGYRTSLICDLLLEVTQRAEIYNVREGILGWLAAGFPVEKPDKLLESAADRRN